jgi:DtxR family transcriptional regulator, Mn-dependent transcriptional regulator
MITVSKEDYLKAILEAESEGETGISATLAHWLSVSPPAVTMALRRLKKDGLVRVQGDGHVGLTPTGRKIARKLTLRHHLIERMLSEIFGMEWYRVHDEAERLEHAVSPDFEARLLAKLGRGGACPHGNLSELESPGSRRRRGLVLLAHAEAGKSPRACRGSQLRSNSDPRHRRGNRRSRTFRSRKSLGYRRLRQIATGCFPILPLSAAGAIQFG